MCGRPGRSVASCPPRPGAARQVVTTCTQVVRGPSILLCSFQPLPAPREQPASPTSPCGGRQGSLAQEAPTASQGLLKLFQRDTPVEDLGAKGVSPEHGLRGPGRGSQGQPVVLCPPRAVPAGLSLQGQFHHEPSEA